VTVDAQFAARRHAWGLSQGLMMLSPAGGFWLLFAIFRGTSAASEGPVAIVPIVALACVPTIVLFAKSLTLRRLADFNATILLASKGRAHARRELRQFAIVNLAQWGLIVVALVWANKTDHAAAIWPLLGLIAGLHFIPIARLWTVPAYALLGASMAMISAGSLMLHGPSRDLVLGIGNCMAMWMTVSYLVQTVTIRTRMVLGLTHP